MLSQKNSTNIWYLVFFRSQNKNIEGILINRRSEQGSLFLLMIYKQQSSIIFLCLEEKIIHNIPLFRRENNTILILIRLNRNEYYVRSFIYHFEHIQPCSSFSFILGTEQNKGLEGIQNTFHFLSFLLEKVIIFSLFFLYPCVISIFIAIHFD